MCNTKSLVNPSPTIITADLQASNIGDTALKELTTGTATSVPTIYGLRTLIYYRALKSARDPAFLLPRAGYKAFLVLITFSLYFGIGNDYDRGVGPVDGTTRVPFSILSMLFMSAANPALAASMYVPAIFEERTTFVRERNDGLYRPVAYLILKLLEEAIVMIPVTIGVQAAIFYTLQLSGSFILFWLLYYILLNVGVLMAYSIAAASPTMDVANAAVPAYGMSLFFFCGLLIRVSEMPNYWRWFTYTNFVTYAFFAFVRN